PVRLIVRDNTNTCRDTLRDTIHVYNPIANYGLDKKYASCPNPPFCDPDVPITGIEYLLLAGGALGLRRLWRNRKK
ncbi:MAG: hypothetical protein NZM13_11035, partial [Cyclobacteriaceae bacterium]|nr:hypothetical protein [Cyclobacteriaceae bacterium]